MDVTRPCTVMRTRQLRICRGRVGQHLEYQTLRINTAPTGIVKASCYDSGFQGSQWTCRHCLSKQGSAYWSSRLPGLAAFILPRLWSRGPPCPKTVSTNLSHGPPCFRLPLHAYEGVRRTSHRPPTHFFLLLSNRSSASCMPAGLAVGTTSREILLARNARKLKKCCSSRSLKPEDLHPN